LKSCSLVSAYTEHVVNIVNISARNFTWLNSLCLIHCLFCCIFNNWFWQS